MFCEFYLGQNRQEVGWVSLRCLAVSVFPSCPSRRQDPSGPGLSRYPQSHHPLLSLSLAALSCVCAAGPGWGDCLTFWILHFSVCSSEFGRNSCPRYQLLLPEVCEYVWLLTCFLFTMSAALLAFVLIIKTQFIIKTSILWWNWVLRIL